MDEVERSLRALQDPNVRDGGSEVGSGGSVLCFAALRGHFDVVRLLLEARAKTELHDFAGSTPLHHAAAYGDLEIARLLLGFGAPKEAADGMGRRPLHLAALKGRLDVLRVLLEHKAEKEAVADGQTAYQLACASGHFEVAQVLREKRRR